MSSCDGSWLAVSETCRLKSERIRWTVNEPIATANAQRITKVSSAETEARRVRIGSRSNAAEMRSNRREKGPASLRAEDVAGSADRVQQARLSFGLELAPQHGDEH